MSVEFWQPEPGTEHNEESLKAQLTGLGYRVSRYVYPPGSCFPAHTHGFDKIEVVLSGCFRMGLAGVSMDLQPGQAIQVPAGAVHDAEVVGNVPVVCLDAVRF